MRSIRYIQGRITPSADGYTSSDASRASFPSRGSLSFNLFDKILFESVIGGALSLAPLVKGGTVCTTVSKRKLEGGFPQRVTDGTNPRNIRILKDLLLV